MVRCAACATENPDAARFCMACGAPLGERAPREERRLVTIVFADLVGFTERSDRADPEDVRRTLIPFHRAAKEAIEGEGGVVDKFIGDAAMGVFGAPVTHEDDPVRAVRAGRALLARIDDLHGRDPDVAIRVAVNTGEAVVAFGAGPQIGEAVAGDVVNTASRMQSLAPRDGLVVGERTWEAVRDAFDAVEMDAVEVKGKAEPLRCWRITGERLVRAVDATPMVGRESAMDELRAALAAAATGARILTVVADPGMGKSRLLDEFRRETEADGVRWWSTGFESYGHDAPFAPLARLVRQAARIELPGAVERPDAEAAAIAAGAEESEEGRAWLAARLEPLLGSVGQEGRFEDAGDTARAIATVLAANAVAPTVCAIEDLHRADPWVRDVLAAVVPGMGDRPLLLLATSRPEGVTDADAWRPYRLPSLDEDATERLIAGALDGGSPVELDAVAARSGGNPLFALEFARSVRDTIGDAVRDRSAEVPTSVRAVIGARLDALPGDARHVVADAAVFGPSFWPDALAGEERTAAAVDDVLAELERRAIVVPREEDRLQGRRSYAFTHALIQEEAYGRLSRGARARRHLDAARWIEGAAGEDAGGFAAVLARHLHDAIEAARAADDEDVLREARDPAIRWLLAAADEVFRLDTPRAFALYEEALSLDPEGEELERALYGSGITGRRTGMLPADEVLGRYERALALARARDDAMAAGQALTRIGSQAGTMGDVDRATAAYDEAIALLEPLPPGRALAAALAFRAEEDMLAGRSAGSLALVERSLPIAEAAGDDELVVMCLHLRGDARCSLGDLDGARDLDEALSIARRGAGASEIVTSLNYVADWRWQLEGCAAALEPFVEAERIAAERGAVSQGRWARMHLSLVLLEMGDWDRVLELVHGFFVERGSGQDATLVAVAEATLATIAVRRGAEGPSVEDVLGSVEGSAELQAVAPAFAAAAELAAASGDRDGALAAIRALDERTRGAIVAYRSGEAPRMVRIAVGFSDLDLARVYLEPLEGDQPILRDALFRDAASTILRAAEHGAESAGPSFVDLMGRWRAYGHAWEELQAAEAALRAGAGDEAIDRRAAEIAARLGVDRRA